MSVQELRYKNVYDINANSLTLNMLEASPGSQSLWINKANGHLYRGSVDLEAGSASQLATDFFILNVNNVTNEVPIPTTVAQNGSSIGCTISQETGGSRVSFPPDLDNGIFTIVYSVQEPIPATSPQVRAPGIVLSGCESVTSRLDNPTPIATSNLCPILISETIRVTDAGAYFELDKTGIINSGKTSATLLITEMDPDPFGGSAMTTGQQRKTNIDEMGIRFEARMDELARSLKQAELRIDKVNARCNDLAADNAQLRKRMAAIIRDDLTWTKKDESGDEC